MKLVTLILSIAALISVGCTKPQEAAPEAPVVVVSPTPEVVVSSTPVATPGSGTGTGSAAQ